jgi:hypothetical protein
MSIAARIPPSPDTRRRWRLDLTAAVAGLLAGFRERRAAHIAARQLRAIPDWMLRDIGFEGCRVQLAAADARQRRRPG